MVRVIQILRKFAFSHCGGGTGAEGWSVSPGRGAVGSWSTDVVLELE